MTRLIKFIQLGLLVLVAIMPFHAFLSVWLGSIFGYQAIFQSWKEVLLLLLLAATMILLYREPARLQHLRRPWVYAAIALIVTGLIITLITRPGLLMTAFGLKTDYEFIVAGLIAALVATTPFVNRLIRTILIGAAIVTGFSLLQIFLLPPDFLTHFGYGPATVVPYQTIAEGTSTLRFPSTLGGPNQLGTYLILPLCLGAALFIRRRRWWQLALVITSLVSLIWTFSRSAWIGAAAALWITVLATIAPNIRRRAAIISGLVAAAGLAVLPLALEKGGPLQYYILHSSVANHDQPNLSDSQHADSLEYGLSSLMQHPLGHGLGTAGPATFHVDAPNIIENYYLQVGYEAGLLAMLLFIVMIIALIFELWKRATHTPLALPAAAAIIGVSIVALVLPAWVDSTTALITFIAAGSVVGLKAQAGHV